MKAPKPPRRGRKIRVTDYLALEVNDVGSDGEAYHNLLLNDHPVVEDLDREERLALARALLKTL